MDNVVATLGNKFRTLDLIAVLSLSIPVFLIYVVYTFIYFLKIDKSNMNKTEIYKSHGLSRFCLAGVFFLFGLILFDVNFEFVTAYITQYIDAVYLGPKLMDKLNSSILYKGISAAYKAVPISILMNFTIICTAIYTSTEGIIASLKTLKLEPGLSVELPAIKRRRLASMFILWCYISIICTIYTFLVGSETVKFELTNCYVSTGLTLIILFLAERSPTLLQDTTQKTRLLKTANNVVSEYNEGDNTSFIDPKIQNMWNNEIFGDKVTESQMRRIKKFKSDMEDKPDQDL